MKRRLTTSLICLSLLGAISNCAVTRPMPYLVEPTVIVCDDNVNKHIKQIEKWSRYAEKGGDKPTVIMPTEDEYLSLMECLFKYKVISGFTFS